MDPSVWIVIVGAIVTVSISGGLPYFLARQMNRNNAAIIVASNARADMIAKRQEDRADKVASDLIEANTKAANATAEQAEIINKKVDGVHTLVNSRYTIITQALLASLINQRADKRENIAMRAAKGEPPSVDTLAIMKTLDDKIAEIETDVAERLKQAEQVRLDTTRSQ